MIISQYTVQITLKKCAEHCYFVNVHLHTLPSIQTCCSL